MKNNTKFRRVLLGLAVTVAVSGLTAINGFAASEATVRGVVVKVTDGRAIQAVAPTNPIWASEIIIKVKPGVSLTGTAGTASVAGSAADSKLGALMGKHRASRVRKAFSRPKPKSGAAAAAVAASDTSGLDRVYVIAVANGSVENAVKDFAKDSSVQYAEPNRTITANYAPNDPYYGSSNSWGQGSPDLWGVKAMNLGTAWDKSKGLGVVVAVVDTGVQADHEDLAANIWTNAAEIANNGIDDDHNGYIDDVHGWDFAGSVANPVPDNDPNDGYGHGTHVAGIIAAVGGNGKGVIGVAPSAKIMPVKALGDNGSGSLEMGAQAITYAVDNGAKVINNSWGGSGYSYVLQDAVSYAVARGVTVVAAAGNSGLDSANFTPANIPQAITVGAGKYDGNLASFSNFGAKVDVVAPGQAVLSTLAATSVIATTQGMVIVGSKYVVLDGTSMAAPHVAGLAALMLSQTSSLTPEQIRNRLRKTSVDRGAAGWDTRYGSGFINADAALSDTVAPARVAGKITSPSVMQAWPYNAVSAPTNVSIIGAANGAGFTAYELAYATNAADGGVGTFTTFANASVATADGVLGTLNASGFSVGSYVIRLRVADSNGAKQDAYTALRIDNVKAGWPRVPNYWYGHFGVGWGRNESRALAFADLDGDGKQEVISADGYGVYAYKHDGSVMPGFPFYCASKASGPVAVADLDKDGKQEIVVTVEPRAGLKPIYAIRSDGTLMPGFPAGTLLAAGYGFNAAAPGIADIDGDGSPDIVARTFNWLNGVGTVNFMAVDKNGAMKTGWPFSLAEGAKVYDEKTKFALADMDKDGKADIVYLHYDASNQSRLRIIGGNGVVKKEVTLTTTVGIPGDNVIVGDMDGNGGLEAFVTAGGKAYLTDNNLVVLPGWPQTLAPESDLNSYMFSDIDDNGDLESVMQYRENNVDSSYRNPLKLLAFNQDGTQAAFYPVRFDPLPSFDFSIAYSGNIPPIVDARLAAAAGPVTLANSYFAKFYAVDSRGLTPAGWPKKFPPALNAPAVGDLDGDGKVEIGSYGQDGMIYIFSEAAATGTKKPIWPTMDANNARTNVALPGVANPNLKRTVIFVYGQTTAGQDMFLRGGIDSVWANANRGTQCKSTAGGDFNLGCSLDITHLNWLHAKTNPWRTGDLHLDWGKLTAAMDGRETGQATGAAGTPAVWTTNDPAYASKVSTTGSGYTPLNTYGPHYWMVDVTMDCSKSVNGWFELKSFISNGPGWEGDIVQTQFAGMTPPPYASKNHFAKCGMINVFSRNAANPVAIKAF